MGCFDYPTCFRESNRTPSQKAVIELEARALHFETVPCSPTGSPSERTPVVPQHQTLNFGSPRIMGMDPVVVR